MAALRALQPLTHIVEYSIVGKRHWRFASAHSLKNPRPKLMALNFSQNGGSAASIKDQNLESDLFLWEPPAKKEEPAAELLSADKLLIDGEFYKRVGFYSAFNKLSEQEFRQAIQSLNKIIATNIANLTKELDDDVARFKKRKEEADEKVREIKSALVRYEEEVGFLKTDLRRLQARLEELRGEIKQTVINIGAKKETLIKDRQAALLAELEALNSELENVVRKRMGLNEEIFAKQKDALKEKKEFLTNLFHKYDKEYSKVLDKLELYSVSGFHALSTGFLYNAGLISATVAGAFFGRFAETNSLASGGVLAFIIQGLFRFSTSFLGQDSDPSGISTRLVNAGILLAIFLGLLALMFVVSWLCQIAYQKLVQRKAPKKKDKKDNSPAEDDSDDETIAFKIDGGDKLPLTTKVSEKNFLGFWLRIIPFLLFVSISFIIISLGTDVANVRGLGNSPAEYGTGFLIALASAGIAYLYLTMFLERRIEQQLNKQGNGKVSWTKLNLELLGLIVAFVTVVMVTLFVFQHPFRIDSDTLSIISFMFFIGCCLFTAFTLGVGIRLQGLESSRQELEYTCNLIQTKLIWISRPREIYLTPKENSHFNNRFIQIRDEIMSLMLERTILTRRAASTPLVTIRKRLWFVSNLNQWLRNKLKWRRREDTEKKDPPPDQDLQNEPEILSASEEVKLVFPKLEAELGVVESEADEVRHRIASVEKEIKYRTEQKGEFWEKKLADLKQEEIRSQNYHKAIADRQKKFHYDVDQERLREGFFTQKIVEGYELGDWFKSRNQANTVIPDFARNGNGTKP
jgi:hypothetical protein